MSIRKALGLSIFLSFLALAMPRVLHELVETAIAFLDGAQVSAYTAASVIQSAELQSVPLSALP
jgi:hypothetical protein